MFSAKPADDQTRDAFGVEPLQLSSERANRLDSAKAGNFLDQPKQRLGADAAQWPIPLRAEHSHVPFTVGIVRNQ